MNVSIAGLGLIGGSLALALRGRHRIRGFDTDASTRQSARAKGFEVVDDLAGLLPADAVIVATPMHAVLPTLAALVPRAGAAILLDVASVRAPIDAFAATTPEHCRMVGFHPMAGRSATGFEAASAELLAGRPFLIVPMRRSDTDSVARAGTLARDAGGQVIVCSVGKHDLIVAALSALPQVFASALMLTAAARVGDVRAVSGPGFSDSTRLAATSPELSTAMLLANAEEVRAALVQARTFVDQIEQAIAARDKATLGALLERAARARGELA